MPEDIVAQTDAPRVGCDCIDLTNDALSGRNEELDTMFLIDRQTGKGRRAIRISTLLIEKKRGQRPSSMIPNFCPICGARYQPEVQP
jgi:hypothetical protein